VGGIVHGRKSFPVARPSRHFLLVAPAHELDSPEFPRVAQFTNEQELASIDGSLHHHVVLAVAFCRVDDLSAFFNSGGGGHGASDMLAGVERGNALGCVKMNGRVDMDRIHFRIAKEGFEIRIALLYSELVADFVQPRLGALADRIHVRLGMVLINRNKFLAEPQTDNSHIDFSLRHVVLLHHAH